MITSAMAAVER